jgi:hypothetical protein
MHKMNDEHSTKERLINGLAELSQRVFELEVLEVEVKRQRTMRLAECQAQAAILISKR